MNIQKNLQYLLVVDLLERMARDGLFSGKELQQMKRLAEQQIFLKAVCQL